MEEKSKMWTNIPRCIWKYQKATLSCKADFCTPCHCHGISTCYVGEKATKQLGMGFMFYWQMWEHTWIVDDLLVFWIHWFSEGGAEWPPCNILFQEGRRNHPSQTAFSAWLSPEICKAINFCKTPWESRDKGTDSAVARYNLGNWVPYRDFTK